MMCTGVLFERSLFCHQEAGRSTWNLRGSVWRGVMVFGITKNMFRVGYCIVSNMFAMYASTQRASKVHPLINLVCRRFLGTERFFQAGSGVHVWLWGGMRCSKVFSSGD